MLSDENGVVPVRSLAAVVQWIGRREPLVYESGGVFQNGFQASVVKVFSLALTESKARAEGGASQAVQGTSELCIGYPNDSAP